ncbi:MAG: hypothetical protein HY608_02130 [Planctomycetes bacterium]|nr:hypothetical protein [Planctomycetota bacterium]
MPVLPLKDVPDGEVASYGGKASHLARLARRGAPVPLGIALPVEAFEGGRLLPEGIEPLGEWLARYSEERFAVRSSAPIEDGARSSGAGRFLTLLDVPASGVVEAVERVAASGAERPVAVLVQRQICARWGGALFTSDPLDAAPGYLVEMVEGHPGPLLSGEADPIRLRLGAGGALLAGTLPAGFPPHAAGQLARLGEASEELLDGAADIEWGIDNGGVWILQVRPVTTFAEGPPPAEIAAVVAAEEARLRAQGAGRTWTRAPLSEGLEVPGALTQWLWERLLAPDGAYGLACASLGHPLPPDVLTPVEALAGRLYLRIDRVQPFHDYGVPARFEVDRFGQVRPVAGKGAILRLLLSPRRFLRLVRCVWKSRHPASRLWREWTDRERPAAERWVERQRAEPLPREGAPLVRRFEEMALHWAREGALPWIRAGVLIGDVAGSPGGARPGGLAPGGAASGEGPHRGPHEMDLAGARWGEWDPRAPCRVAAERLAAEASAAVPSGPSLQALREETKDVALRALDEVRRVALALANALGIGERVFDLRPEELHDLARRRAGAGRLRRTADERAAHARAWESFCPPWAVRSDAEHPLASADPPGVHRGIPFSPGLAEGAPWVGPDAPADAPAGAVVLLRALTPAWAERLTGAAAVLCEAGGALSHGAILAREARLPAVGSLAGVRERLAKAARVRVNGSTGEVRALPA